ncbi:MAG TPA: hypothetical protein DDW52_07605 [Planctomycetaceae bacterium]|nr:hypothetical protein [Planctomycetaceae bacterium]
MPLTKLFRSAAIAASFAVLVPAISLKQAVAQKPVATVSIAPLDRLTTDINELLTAVSASSVQPMISFFADHYTQGMDRTRPAGVLVTLNNQAPSALIFLPIKDEAALFTALEGIGVQADELESNLWELITPGQAMFVKKSDGWLFVAQTEDELSALPADPAAALGGLYKTYDLAVRMNVQALPAEMKNMVMENMRMGFENGLQANPNQTEDEREAARQAGEAQIEQINRMMEETEQAFVGWSFDSANQRMYVDVGSLAVPGTSMAKSAELALEAESDYSAFILPNAVMKFRQTALIAEGDREASVTSVNGSLKQVESMIDKDDKLDAGLKDLLKGVVGSLGALVKDTINEGKLDGVGSASLADGRLQLLIGGRIADGNALAAKVQEAAAELEGKSGAPEFEFGYETYKGVTLHRATVALPPQAQQIIGDQALLTVGTADKGFIIGLDAAGDALVKGAIDAMQSSGPQKVSPFEADIQVGAILEFVKTIVPNPMVEKAAETIQSYAESDMVRITSRAIPRGATIRLSIDEGILQAIGGAVQGGGGGAGGF